MQAKFGQAYNFIPKSYLLPQETALLINDYERIRHTSKKLYIIKPANSSQGKGIYVTSDIDEVYLFKFICFSF